MTPSTAFRPSAGSLDALEEFGRAASDVPVVAIRAGAPWDGTRLADQHVAVRLAGEFAVLYLDPPVSALRRRAGERSRVHPTTCTALADRLLRVSPRITPGKSSRAGAPIADAVFRSILAGVARRLRTPVHTVLSISADGFGPMRERQRVFWARDDFSSGARLMGLPSRRIERQERRVERAADLVVAVSPLLEEKWRARGLRTALVPNGCDVAHFARSDGPTPTDVVLGPPRCVFSGTISDRIDFDLLEEVADAGANVLLIGARQRTLTAGRFEDLIRRPNVQWLGPRPYEELPNYLALADVGLLPYTPSAFNRASFPLKLLEYLAAGLPVVATDLPAVDWLGTDLVARGGSGDFGARALREAGRRHDAALVVRRRELAAEHDWSRRVETLTEVLGLRGSEQGR